MARLATNCKCSEWWLHVTYLFWQVSGFGICQLFVADACQVHGFFLCVAEFEYVEQFSHFCFHIGELFKGFLVIVG